MSWPAFWSQNNWKSKLLWPLSKLVCWEAQRRLTAFEKRPPKSDGRALTLVVGNVVVGGSGKTPFIIWLVKQLQAKQLKVGIISRGYGGKAKQWPQQVTAQSDAALVGDEPVLLAKQLACPIAVSPLRAEAAALLEKQYDLDVIISDDGLQHYGLARDIEVVLVDAERMWGNGLCMPAGPLREPLSRLNQVDFIVYNGELPAQQNGSQTEELWPDKSYAMSLQPVCFHQLGSPDNILDKQAFSGQSVSAVAGIGNPQRFFNTLTSLDISVDGFAFKDHHAFSVEDFKMLDQAKPLIMTQKDAVKCTEFALDDSSTPQAKNWWYLEVEPQADAALFEQLYQLILQKRQSS